MQLKAVNVPDTEHDVAAHPSGRRHRAAAPVLCLAGPFLTQIIHHS